MTANRDVCPLSVDLQLTSQPPIGIWIRPSVYSVCGLTKLQEGSKYIYDRRRLGMIVNEVKLVELPQKVGIGNARNHKVIIVIFSRSQRTD